MQANANIHIVRMDKTINFEMIEQISKIVEEACTMLHSCTLSINRDVYFNHKVEQIFGFFSIEIKSILLNNVFYLSFELKFCMMNMKNNR